MRTEELIGQLNRAKRKLDGRTKACRRHKYGSTKRAPINRRASKHFVRMARIAVKLTKKCRA